MNKLRPKTLLVIKNRAMGDSVIGLATLTYLKELLPETRIIYGVPKWIAPLYHDVETPADEIIPIELKKIWDWPSLWSDLKKYNIDAVFEMFQSGRTQKFFSLWSRFAGPDYVAHNHHSEIGPVFDQGQIKANIQRDIDGAWTFFDLKNTTPPSHLNYTPSITVKSPQKPVKKIILGAVATRETKMWPLENYKEFVHLFLKKYQDHDVIIPLGPGDKKIENELQDILTLERCRLLKTELSQIPRELNGSSLYVGNDTGLKHICIALGIPSFTLFGPEPPLEWHPYDTKVHRYYFKTPLDCRTKEAHYCGRNTCESMICLNEFTANQLLKEIEPYFNSKS